LILEVPEPFHRSKRDDPDAEHKNANLPVALGRVGTRGGTAAANKKGPKKVTAASSCRVLVTPSERLLEAKRELIIPN